LTRCKTRACNFRHVILAQAKARAETTGTEGRRCAVGDVIVSLVHDALGISADDAAEQSWQDRALCAQTDPEAFFPEKGGSTREAKRVCRSCDVRAECLEYALGHDERFGIWGGLSERERRRLKRQAV
jgi:WhiB family transcriptional regulator, redox-sensing transcriptional regulator